MISTSDFIQLRPIPKNGTIAITAPASMPDAEKLKRGLAYIEQRGYKVVVGESCSSQLDYLAGDDALRANELLDFIDDDSVDAIFCARGGFGSMKILRMLDYELIKEKRKLLVGFSDITSLLLAIYAETGVGGISGMMPAYDFHSKEIPKKEADLFWQLIETGKMKYESDAKISKINTFEEQQFSGKLMAGTLSLITKLLGTKYFPDLKNSILVLEDVGEPTHKLESYLEHLSLSGTISDLKALILGTFIPAESEEYPILPSYDEVYKRVFRSYPRPILSGLNYGHIPNKISLPIGLPITVNLGTSLHISSNVNLFNS